MIRRWKAGDKLCVSGIWFRIEPGKKQARVSGGQDLRLEAWSGRAWVPVEMALGAFLADFFYENEEVLYPPPNMGGQYYIEYVCNEAAHRGWVTAALNIRKERGIA